MCVSSDRWLTPQETAAHLDTTTPKSAAFSALAASQVLSRRIPVAEARPDGSLTQNPSLKKKNAAALSAHALSGAATAPPNSNDSTPHLSLLHLGSAF
jgi:hypothetical protein